MSNLSQQLQRLRKSRGITQNKLASDLGVSISSISMYENGNREPDIETLEAFADYFNVDINFLTGAASSSPHRVPVLGSVAAGIPISAIQDILDYEDISPEMARNGDYFGLRIRGNSMEPRIVDGDVVIVRMQSRVESGDVAIVLVNGDDATCKRVVYHENGVSLNAFNPAVYPTHFYTFAETATIPVQIIGRVMELRGKF